MKQIQKATALALGILSIGAMAGVAAAEPVKENVDRSVVVYYETTMLNAEQLREIENLDNRVLQGTPPRKVISLEDSAPINAPSIMKNDPYPQQQPKQHGGVDNNLSNPSSEGFVDNQQSNRISPNNWHNTRKNRVPTRGYWDIGGDNRDHLRHEREHKEDQNDRISPHDPGKEYRKPINNKDNRNTHDRIDKAYPDSKNSGGSRDSRDNKRKDIDKIGGKERDSRYKDYNGNKNGDMIQRCMALGCVKRKNPGKDSGGDRHYDKNDRNKRDRIDKIYPDKSKNGGRDRDSKYDGRNRDQNRDPVQRCMALGCVKRKNPGKVGGGGNDRKPTQRCMALGCVKRKHHVNVSGDYKYGKSGGSRNKSERIDKIYPDSKNGGGGRDSKHKNYNSNKNRNPVQRCMALECVKRKSTTHR